MFLSTDQLIKLTGYKRPSAQLRYIRANRIAHRLDGFGRPIVLEKDVNTSIAPVSKKAYNATLNLAAI